MKKILLFSIATFGLYFGANAQTVTDTTWTSFSGTAYKWHDSIPDTSTEQRFGLMYQMLDTSYIPTHILIDRTISSKVK